MLGHPRLFGSFALAAILAIAAPRAQAQCGPDGLAGGPCCTAAIANIPAIPAMQLDCRSICFNGCNVSQQFLDCVNLGAHVPAMSGELIRGRALATSGDRVVAAQSPYGSGSVPRRSGTICRPETGRPGDGPRARRTSSSPFQVVHKGSCF